MPRGRREGALITLVNQLDALDAKRRTLVGQIKAAADSLGSGTAHEISSPRGRRSTGRRKGFTMSAEARAKISAAQKKRWSKQKASEK